MSDASFCLPTTISFGLFCGFVMCVATGGIIFLINLMFIGISITIILVLSKILSGAEDMLRDYSIIGV